MEPYIILYLEHYNDLNITITSFSLPIPTYRVTVAVNQKLKKGQLTLVGPKFGVLLYTPPILQFCWLEIGRQNYPVLYLGHTLTLPIADPHLKLPITTAAQIKLKKELCHGTLNNP
jgi:hypothetical protein